MEVDESVKNNNGTPFTHPRRFSSNFQRLIREITKQTLTPIKNRYDPLSEDSESDIGEDEIQKIIKKRKKATTSKEMSQVERQEINNKATETH